MPASLQQQSPGATIYTEAGMESATKQHLEHLRQKKDDFLATLATWTPDQRSFRAGPAFWCANQVLDHVVKTESGVFSEFRRCLPLRVRPPFNESIRGTVVNCVMNSPLRVSVPKTATSVLPESACDPAAIVASWNQLRVEMQAWADSLPSRSHAFGAFRHPVSGWMSLSQALAFLCAHIRHHCFQLSRIRNAPGWPVQTRSPQPLSQ